MSLALGASATFVARGHDKDRAQLQQLLLKAHQHKGFSFVEIYTNCRIFNDGAFDLYTNRETNEDHTVWLEHDMPLVFGKKKDKGIKLEGYTPTVIDLNESGHSISDVLVHNEKDSTLAFILANMTYSETLPRPMGTLQNLDRSPYEERVVEQIQHEVETKGVGNLESLLLGGSYWEVK